MLSAHGSKPVLQFWPSVGASELPLQPRFVAACCIEGACFLLFTNFGSCPANPLAPAMLCIAFQSYVRERFAAKVCFIALHYYREPSELPGVGSSRPIFPLLQINYSHDGE